MTIHKSEKHTAFEHEAMAHADLLYNYALRMTGSPEDADDLVQETFMKAYRFWESYEPGTNIRAWLFRILKNSYINRYRKEVREPETIDYDEGKCLFIAGRDDMPGVYDLQNAIFDHLLDDQVTEAVGRLPETFRTVVILSDIEGLTYEEIAHFIDCPLGTVRSRLHRGRKLLSATLSEYAREHGYLTGSVAGV
jgi:RNA polymerase sigma-70 factor, ECF subfamily